MTQNVDAYMDWCETLSNVKPGEFVRMSRSLPPMRGMKSGTELWQRGEVVEVITNFMGVVNEDLDRTFRLTLETSSGRQFDCTPKHVETCYWVSPPRFGSGPITACYRFDARKEGIS